MSFAEQTAPAVAPSRAPLRPARRTDLRPVEAPARRRRPRVAYGVIAIIAVALIAAAQMGLSVMSTQASFEIAALDKQQSELELEAQALYDEVAGLASPQNLATRASELGMVIDAAPSYLRLSDGAVVGAGVAAEGASTVDVQGRSAVGNAFLADTQAQSAPEAAEEAPSSQAEDAAVVEEPAEPEAPVGPPAIEDGLPSPATR